MYEKTALIDQSSTTSGKDVFREGVKGQIKWFLVQELIYVQYYYIILIIFLNFRIYLDVFKIIIVLIKRKPYTVYS